MARKTGIEDLLFPVELQPVYADIKRQGKIFQIAIPNSQVVVNSQNGHPLGVVSKNYRVVTNEEAIEMGKQCCKELLGLTDYAELEIFSAYAPSTYSYCHIDLIHKGFAMNLYDNGTTAEIYLPFVRITNSYNTTRSLRFDIGFCRKVCLNGVIFESQTIKFMFSHVKHELGESIKFEIKKNQFDALKAEFTKTIASLLEVAIPEDKAKVIFNHILGIPKKEDINLKSEKDQKEYGKLTEHANNCLQKNYAEMNANSYALFNAITDFASHPPKNRFVRKDENAMQRSAGAWINEFKEHIKTRPFDIDKYIKKLTEEQDPKKGNNPYNKLSEGGQA